MQKRVLNAEKIKLMWGGTRYNRRKFPSCAFNPTLTLGSSTVKAADAVRVLGDLFTSDLGLEKHVTTVSAKCFFNCVNCVDRETAATQSTLVHVFVTSRIDYVNALLANAPSRTTTDKLQRVLNAAALVIKIHCYSELLTKTDHQFNTKV